jgi:hypothetical protein
MKQLLIILLIPFGCFSQNFNFNHPTIESFGDGKPLTKSDIEFLMNEGNIQLGVGTYCFPTDFKFDFGSKNVSITGIPGKTFITSWDSTSATNFNPKPLDITLPDFNPDGIFVVSNHPALIGGYGGGLQHLNLKGVYNTDGKNVFYVQGTILEKRSGIWKRHFTGNGFITSGDMMIKNIGFDNCMFYLFSPFGSSKTSNQFSIENCSFNNISRVISSISYSGIDQDSTWFTHLQVYSSSGVLRFNNFSITGCRFSNIHSFIVSGFPPSANTNIKDNVIENSKTILSAFNLLIKYYGNDYYFSDRINQNISGNSFRNIHPVQNNSTTALIRTSGNAIITGNNFTDCSQQICFFGGGNTLFNDNFISKWNDGLELLSPVILIKSGTGTHSIQNNIIIAPMSSIVYLEGMANVNISGNSIIGCTRFRIIDANTAGISKDRVYYVTNLNRFIQLAGNYDTSIINGNHVYFNKDLQKWQKTKINLIGFVFSKSDAAINNQSVNISNNSLIECEGITNISSKITGSFKSVDIIGNKILNCIYLNTGTVPIDEYNFLYNNTAFIPSVVTQAIKFNYKP